MGKYFKRRDLALSLIFSDNASNFNWKEVLRILSTFENAEFSEDSYSEAMKRKALIDTIDMKIMFIKFLSLIFLFLFEFELTILIYPTFRSIIYSIRHLNITKLVLLKRIS